MQSHAQEATLLPAAFTAVVMPNADPAFLEELYNKEKPEYSDSLKRGTITQQERDSLSGYDPPIPLAGMVNPPEASAIAENFSCIPAREKCNVESFWLSIMFSRIFANMLIYLQCCCC